MMTYESKTTPNYSRDGAAAELCRPIILLSEASKRLDGILKNLCVLRGVITVTTLGVAA
jgi:hypothetical protein